ncbi:RxLR effector protein [Phytophthora megakarya]|uniref:RxLR effector protein n=1 Tax=Phytophthora megakarya TaxID=4795 RepID=A0A225UKT1_9STRA|nr:RxLR effector protein [Phytophthora megakarya]
MCIGLILLFLVTTLINSDVVSGPAFQLQHTQDVIQFGETGEAVFHKGRSLRAQVQTNEGFNQDNEERLAVAGLDNKLSSGVKV